MTRDFGYAKAKHQLQKHFENKYKFATAYLEGALSWPSINGGGCQCFAVLCSFLRGCCNVTEEVQYLQELDMPSNMRAIISKLPFKLSHITFWKLLNVELCLKILWNLLKDKLAS